MAADSLFQNNRVQGGGGDSVLHGGAAEGGAVYVVGAITARVVNVSFNGAHGGVEHVSSGVARGGALAQRSGSTAAVSLTHTWLNENIASGGQSRKRRCRGSTDLEQPT